MNNLIEKELKKVEKADLSHFDEKTNTYHIPKRVDIPIKEDNCYLIYLEDTFFNDTTLRINWNNNSVPEYRYLKIDVSKVMSKMIKVVAVGYDYESKKDLAYFWHGWLNTDEIKVLEKI